MEVQRNTDGDTPSSAIQAHRIFEYERFALIVFTDHIFGGGGGGFQKHLLMHPFFTEFRSMDTMFGSASFCSNRARINTNSEGYSVNFVTFIFLSAL